LKKWLGILLWLIDDLLILSGLGIIVWITHRLNPVIGWYLIGFLLVGFGLLLAKPPKKPPRKGG
jgi:uncharacterized membrane protein SirB2